MHPILSLINPILEEASRSFRSLSEQHTVFSTTGLQIAPINGSPYETQQPFQIEPGARYFLHYATFTLYSDLGATSADILTDFDIVSPRIKHNGKDIWNSYHIPGAAVVKFPAGTCFAHTVQLFFNGTVNVMTGALSGFLPLFTTITSGQLSAGISTTQGPVNSRVFFACAIHASKLSLRN